MWGESKQVVVGNLCNIPSLRRRPAGEESIHKSLNLKQKQILILKLDLLTLNAADPLTDVIVRPNKP